MWFTALVRVATSLTVEVGCLWSVGGGPGGSGHRSSSEGGTSWTTVHRNACVSGGAATGLPVEVG